MLQPLCDCALAAAHVESRVGKWDFSWCSLFTSLSFGCSAPLPPTLLAPVVLTLPYTPAHSLSMSLLFKNCLALMFYLCTDFLLFCLGFILLFSTTVDHIGNKQHQWLVKTCIMNCIATMKGHEGLYVNEPVRKRMLIVVSRPWWVERYIHARARSCTHIVCAASVRSRACSCGVPWLWHLLLCFVFLFTIHLFHWTLISVLCMSNGPYENSLLFDITQPLTTLTLTINK